MRQLLVLPAAILFITPHASADTTTWVGNFSSNWFSDANWSEGIPQNGDTVNIAAATSNPSASSQVSLSNAIINFSSGSDPAFNAGLTLGTDATLNMFSGAFAFASFLEASDPSSVLNLAGGAIDLGGPLTVGNAGVTTIATNLQGSSGSVVKNGNGTLVLAGSNSFNGGLTINDGAIEFSSGQTLGGLGNSITFNGGILKKTTSGNVVIPMTINPGGGAIDVPPGVGFGYVASIAGNGALSKFNDGTLVVSESNSYTGGTNIRGGEFVISGDDATDKISSEGNVDVGSGVLIVDSSETIGGLSGSGFVALNDNLTVNDDDQTTTFSGIISGTGNLAKAGSGVLTLSGANTATGSYIVNNGTLELTGSNTPTGVIQVNGSSTLAIGGADAIDVLPNRTVHLATFNAKLRVDSAEDFGAVTGFGEVMLNDALTLNNGAQDSTFDGTFEGPGTLLKDGSGEFRFIGQGEHSGPTIVHAGQLKIDGGGHLKQSTLSVQSGGTIHINSGGTATAAAVDVTGGNLNVNNNGDLFAGPINVASGSLAILNGGNAEADSVAGNGTIQINAGGTLTLNGGDLTWNKSGASTIAGSIRGTGGISKYGDINSTLTLSGVNTYTGDTLISSGMVVLAGSDGADVVDETGIFNLSSSWGTLVVPEEEDIGPITGFGTINMTENLTVVSHTNSTFRGNFDGVGTFIKSGSETLTLAADAQLDHAGAIEVTAGTFVVEAAAAYTGPTTISGGILLANNTTGSATGAGPVQVNGGGKFGGSGSVASQVTVASGGAIAPGASIGLLNIGSLVMEPGSTFAVELLADGGVPGIDFDQLAVAGNATLEGNLAIELLDGFAPQTVDTFTVLASTTLSNSFENVANGARLDTVDGVGSFLVSYDSLTNDVVLSDFLPALAGDFDLDSDVDGADFLKWQRGESSSPLSANDLADWEANYGMVAPLAAASNAVPEPSTLLLGAIVGLVGATKRRS